MQRITRWLPRLSRGGDIYTPHHARRGTALYDEPRCQPTRQQVHGSSTEFKFVLPPRATPRTAVFIRATLFNTETLHQNLA